MGKEVIAKNAGSVAHPKAKGLVEKLRRNGRTMAKTDSEKLYTFVLKPEHRGKFVAVIGGQKKKVVAFGTNYRRVVEEAEKSAENPFSIMFAPEKGVLYTR